MKNSWDNLTMTEKAEMMKVAVSNGIYNLDDIKNAYNSYAKGGRLYEDGGKFSSSLDWSPDSWFSKRVAKPDGTLYNEEEAKILASHVPEYLKIEQEAKQNGTWLQMPNGTIWTGDPRSWVMMQSEAYKKNYSPQPWYTGQAEWKTTFDYGQGPVETNKVTRAPYYNEQMWFSNDKDYGRTFADYISEDGQRWRGDLADITINPDKYVKGHNFLTGIPKEGNYRILESPENGHPDAWQHMPFEIIGNSIKRLPLDQIIVKYGKNRRADKKRILTDDVVNWSKDLGDQGIFIQNVHDGPVMRTDERGVDYLDTFPPINEFISQPDFTNKVKFIEGNTGDFDINNPYKYAYNFNKKENNINYAAFGGPLVERANKYYDGGDAQQEVINKIIEWSQTDPNTGERNPFYDRGYDTYGTVELPEVDITEHWTPQGLRNTAAREGRQYMYDAMNQGYNVVGPLLTTLVSAPMDFYPMETLLSGFSKAGSAVQRNKNLAQASERAAQGNNILMQASDNPYSYKGVSPIKNNYERLQFQQKIQGVKPSTGFTTIDVSQGFNENVRRGLSKEVQNDLMNNTIERNINELRKAGYNESFITEYRDKARKLMEEVPVGRYSAEDYKKALQEHLGGFYNPDNNFISLNEGGTDILRAEGHEGRHMLDHKLDDEYTRTSTWGNDFDADIDAENFKIFKGKQQSILSKAYDDDFVNIPNTEYAGPLKGYKNMAAERVTTNRDARYALFKNTSYKDWTPAQQNQIIRRMSDEEIFDAVENSNGYGRRYIQFLRDNDKLTPEKAQQFREAMQHVGVVAAPVAIGAGTVYGISQQPKVYNGLLMQ